MPSIPGIRTSDKNKIKSIAFSKFQSLLGRAGAPGLESVLLKNGTEHVQHVRFVVYDQDFWELFLHS